MRFQPRRRLDASVFADFAGTALPAALSPIPVPALDVSNVDGVPARHRHPAPERDHRARGKLHEADRPGGEL